MTTETSDVQTDDPRKGLLRPVVTFLYVNLAMSALLAVLTVVFKNSLIDYQLQHMLGSAQSTSGKRDSLERMLWIRPASVLVISIVYVRLAARLRYGRRSTYRRVLAISIAGAAGMILMVTTTQYPLWMQALEVVQAIVLVGLLIAVTRQDVRAHFSGDKAAKAVA